MKKITLCVFSALTLLAFTACEKEDLTTEQSNLKLSKEVLVKLESIGVNPANADYYTRTLFDGSFEEGVKVDDLFFTFDELTNTPDLGNDGVSRHYRTSNIVASRYRTIDIIGYTGGSYALTSKERTGLQMAVDNFNELNMSVTFRLTFGTNYQDKDMIVYHDAAEEAAGNAGGVAGFPDRYGRPYKTVALFGLSPTSTAVHAHTITHEIGHAIGLRHTDWQTRQSCGDAGESTGSEGAIYIPGTPSGYDSSSLMLACSHINTASGEFNANDKNALEYLY